MVINHAILALWEVTALLGVEVYGRFVRWKCSRTAGYAIRAAGSHL